MKYKYQLKPIEPIKETTVQFWLDENDNFVNLWAADGHGNVWQLITIYKREHEVEVFEYDFENIGLKVLGMKK